MPECERHGRPTAARLLARCLEVEGVTHVFGVPGEENIDLLDALADSSIRFVPTRHESGAAFIANVLGRLTGRAGVCLATLGPGATNMLTGVADATQDFAPVVAITGQTALAHMHKESHQTIDSRTLYEPVTKWSVRVLRGETVPEIVGKAFRLAEAEKPGAVHIELPEDVAESPVYGDALWVRAPSREAAAPPEPSDAAVRAAAACIRDARRPVILAGHGVVRAGAVEALRRFARELGIPVLNTFMAKGVMPPEDPLSLLTVGLQSRDYPMVALEEADLVIAVGYDAIEYAPERWNPGGRVPVVHISRTPPDPEVHYPVCAEVIGGLAAALERLRATVGRRVPCEAAAGWRALVEARILGWGAGAATARDRAGLDPRAALRPLEPWLARGATVVSDVGAHKVWVARHLQTGRPNSVLISNGFAAMGIAVPGAVAAKLVRPDRPAIALAGDGGFLMTCAELETAHRLGTPIIIIVWVDGGYGLISWKQELKFGRVFGTSFTNPDLSRLAEAFSAHYAYAPTAEALASVLETAAQADRSTIIEVPIDYTANLRLSEELESAAAAAGTRR
ncbi:MAG: acetolactate synthase large subunit [Firmicutes bacterium]|nr:acetolactate synthase large subunit [Bacillota bacterium]